MTARSRPYLAGVLLVVAALIFGARLAAALLGFEESLVVLSGMRPAGWSDLEAGLACALYVVAHLASILVAPILVLGAVIQIAISAIAARRARASGGSSGSRAG